MNRRLAQWVPLVAMLLVARAAHGQAAEVTIGYQGLPYKASGESNTGIQVSEGVLLHVGAGAEAGYDTNVFYASVDPIASPMIRTSVFGDLSNATRTGAAGRISFDARAGVVYRRYQSDDAAVENFSNAWMPTAGLALSAGGGQFGFGIADTFARLEDPPYNPGQLVPITRYNNQASAEGRWAPGGGRITATLRYTNMVDIFQGTYSYASTDGNYLMLDGSWKWLPKTAIFLNVSQGYIFYLNQAEADANNKESSYPLVVTAGLRGLLTEKTSATVARRLQQRFLLRQFLDRRLLGQHVPRPLRHAASVDAQPDRGGLPARFSERGRRLVLLQRDVLRVVRPADRGAAGAGSFGALFAPELRRASSSTRCRW